MRGISASEWLIRVVVLQAVLYALFCDEINARLLDGNFEDTQTERPNHLHSTGTETASVSLLSGVYSRG